MHTRKGSESQLSSRGHDTAWLSRVCHTSPSQNIGWRIPGECEIDPFPVIFPQKTTGQRELYGYIFPYFGTGRDFTPFPTRFIPTIPVPGPLSISTHRSRPARKISSHSRSRPVLRVELAKNHVPFIIWGHDSRSVVPCRSGIKVSLFLIAYFSVSVWTTDKKTVGSIKKYKNAKASFKKQRKSKSRTKKGEKGEKADLSWVFWTLHLMIWRCTLIPLACRGYVKSANYNDLFPVTTVVSVFRNNILVRYLVGW